MILLILIFWLTTDLAVVILSSIGVHFLFRPSIGVGGTRVATIWDVIIGAFALHSEPVIRPYSDYAGQAPGEDPFDAVDPPCY